LASSALVMTKTERDLNRAAAQYFAVCFLLLVLFGLGALALFAS
jgi:hypothetical protein